MAQVRFGGVVFYSNAARTMIYYNRRYDIVSNRCDCIRTIKTTAVVDLGVVLVLFIDPVVFRKRERFRLIICQTIPTGNPVLNPQVVITDGANVYLTFNCLSEFVRRYNIECRTCYEGLASNDPLHIQLRGLRDNCRCPNELLTSPAAAVLTPVTVTLALVTAAIGGVLAGIVGAVTGAGEEG